MKKKFVKITIISLAVLVLMAGLLSGCNKGNEGAKDSPAPATSPKDQTPFERDLEYVRQGQFTYVLVFARKDKGTFTKEDIDYLKANSPPETNQWISTDTNRRIIAGTNFEFKQEHYDALNKRFTIENLSGK